MSAPDPRLAEIEAAANLIAERLAVAEPAVVDAVVGDALTDEDLAALVEWADFIRELGREPWRQGRKVGRTIYRQLRVEPSDNDPLIGVMDDEADAEFVVFARNSLPNLIADLLASRAEVERVRDQNADAIARGAELARAFNAAGRREMSGPSLPGTAGGGGTVRGAVAPSRPPKHVWTCGLKFGDPTCECEAFSRS